MDRHEIVARLNALHQLLHKCDYIGIKIATGRATTADYATQIENMAGWAAEINDLETQLAALPDDGSDI